MLFSGQVMRGGLFWVLFWAVAKEYLARGARTAMPKTSTILEIKQRDLQNGEPAWAQKRAHPTYAQCRLASHPHLQNNPC